MRNLILVSIVFFINISLFAQKYLPEATKIKAKADSFFVIGNLNEAAKLYKEELSIYQKNKDLHRIAISLSNVSAIHFSKSEFDEAIRLCKEALTILPHNPKTDTTQFRLYRFLGMYYGYQKNLDSSDIYYEKAEKLINNSKIVAQCSDIISFYNDLGVKASNIVDLKRAEILLQKAEKSLYLDSLYNKAAIYHNQGRVYYLQRRFDIALKYYKKAEQNTHDDRTLAYVLKEQANCLLYMANLAEAKTKINQANKVYHQFLSENPTQPDLTFESTYNFFLGLLYNKQKEFKLAEMYFRKAIETDSKLGNKSLLKTESYRIIADMYSEQKLFLKAFETYQEALRTVCFDFYPTNIFQLPQSNKVISEREYFRILVGKAKVFKNYSKQTNDIQYLTNSLDTYKKSIEVADKMRKSYESANAKQFFTETYFDVYEQAIELANTLFRLTKKSSYKFIAYDFYEKSRAAILNDALREADIKFKTIAQDLLQQEKVLNKQISLQQLALSRLKDTTKLKEIYDQLTELELRKLNLSKRFEKESPNYFQLKYANEKTNVAQLQKQVLDKKTALISYFYTAQHLFIFTITDSDFKIQNHRIDYDFENKIHEFRKVLATSPQGKKYNGTMLSAELYKVLIKPIEKEIEGKKRLIIIRDAELNYLPFEVLAKQKNEFLLKKYTISYAYSASLLAAPANAKTSKNNGLLAFAPFSDYSFQNAQFRDENLGELPKSAEEVEKIGGDIYTENEATKKRFYETYRNKNIIHFATHAITDDTDPLKSFIAFYPDGIDYKLFTNELYDLDLQNTNLIMLSACQTGVGKLQKGEGLMSLARAFTYAGAKVVITTLWNAHDEASAYISERFYAHLKNGLKTDEALCQAKLDFLASDLSLRYEHPYYWANFILIGPAETIEFGTSWWVWGVSIAFLILIVLFFYRRMVTKK